MADQIDLEYQYLQYPVDALEKQRQADRAEVEEQLKSHDILGEFLSSEWESFKDFIRVEEYHTDTMFLHHDDIVRKIYLLLEGKVSAYILTKESPKPVKIYDFAENSILTELNALLGGPTGRRHYGFIASSDCKLVSFDLDYIEDEVENFESYQKFIDILFDESGKRTAEICNIALEKKLDLKDLLGKHNFFANIDDLTETNLNSLADRMRYVFLPSNEVLIDSTNNKNIYLVEAGTVAQTKTYKEFKDSDSYIYTRNLQSIYINDDKYNLQEVFTQHARIEDELNTRTDFDIAIEGKLEEYKISTENTYADSPGAAKVQEPVEYKTIHITEDIHRYGIVGEDSLANFADVKVEASTKTPCCLIEIQADSLFEKRSVATQIIGFFNNKINDMQNKVVERQQHEVNVKNKYIALVNFSFMFMLIMAGLGISGRFHSYLNFLSHNALLHHLTVVSVVCFLLMKLVKPLNFQAHDFGITKNQFREGMKQAAIGTVFIIVVATGVKELYVILHAHQFGMKLFQPDLVINENLTAFGFYMFLLLYVVYIFIYEICARGILQSIFNIILADHSNRMQYWGSIFASSAVASQFHMSLFHEFSIVLFLGNIVAGVIFANTRNLWAVFTFHSIFSVYILTVLGLLPGSHF